MALDFTNFKFQSHYIGVWSRTGHSDDKFSGTLFIDGQNIWIELFFESTKLPENLESISGITYSTDSNGDDHSANIIAEGLKFEKISHLGNGLRHYKYSVSEIFIYEGSFQKEQIQSINIKAEILNEWSANVLKSAYSDVSKVNIPSNHYILHHCSPHHNWLFNCDIMSVYMSYIATWAFGGINRGVEQQAILHISFRQKLSFDDAMQLSNQIVYLLYLITNRVFPVEYLLFENNCSDKCFYKASGSYNYQYIKHYAHIEPHTLLTDFSESEIKTISKNWVDLCSEYAGAINSFFESHTNVYTRPASLINNCISVIETLSQMLDKKEAYLDESTKNARLLIDIINQYKISKQDATKLKQAFLMVKGTELKSRLSKFLESIKDYLPYNFEEDYVKKIINTRHRITHPKSKQEPYYCSKDYPRLATELSLSIHIFLLKAIGVKQDIIKKLVQTRGLAAGLS